MPYFVVIAYDGTDPDAIARRKRVRPGHFEGIKPMVARGEIISAAALRNEAGDMIGSTVITEFASRADLDAWLAREPYVREGVWQRIEVHPAHLAVSGGKIMQ